MPLSGQQRRSMSHESVSFTKMKTAIFKTGQRGKRLQKKYNAVVPESNEQPDWAAGIYLPGRPPLL